MVFENFQVVIIMTIFIDPLGYYRDSIEHCHHDVSTIAVNHC